MGRILAVDLGTRRVGLALTDSLQLIASPLGWLPFTGLAALARELLRLAAGKEVERAVIGLPLQEDGREGPGCRAARSLAGKLQAGGLAAVLWDERYTSLEAEEALRAMGEGRRAGRVDPVAAALILQDYLRSPQAKRSTLRATSSGTGAGGGEGGGDDASGGGSRTGSGSTGGR